MCSQVGQVDTIGGGVETGVGGVEAEVGEAEAQDEVASGSGKHPGNSRAMVATTSTTDQLDDLSNADVLTMQVATSSISSILILLLRELSLKA